MSREEIYAEATSIYDQYVEALEAGAFQALQAYAQNLSERIIPRGVETNLRVAADVLTMRTGDLLDLVGFQAGTLRLKPRSMEVGRMVRRCARRMEGEARMAGVRLRILVSRGLPRIVADPDRLDQVVSNLLQHALRYAASGNRVDLRARATCRAVVIEVQDYGPGVSRPDRSRIFQLHARGSDVRPGIPGLGVGLALSRELVRQHRGDITLESEEGQGSVFRVELPLGAKRKGQRA